MADERGAEGRIQADVGVEDGPHRTREHLVAHVRDEVQAGPVRVGSELAVYFRLGSASTPPAWTLRTPHPPIIGLALGCAQLVPIPVGNHSVGNLAAFSLLRGLLAR